MLLLSQNKDVMLSTMINDQKKAPYDEANQVPEPVFFAPKS